MKAPRNTKDPRTRIGITREEGGGCGTHGDATHQESICASFFQCHSFGGSVPQADGGNVRGVTLCYEYAVKQMIIQGSGRIIGAYGLVLNVCA